MNFFAELLDAAYHDGVEAGKEGVEISDDQILEMYQIKVIEVTDNYMDHIENTTTVTYTVQGQFYEYSETAKSVVSAFKDGHILGLTAMV
jgi:hypothetical protein